MSEIVATVSSQQTPTATVSAGGTVSASVGGSTVGASVAGGVGPAGPAGPSGVATFADATDVQITDLAAGDVIRYSGGKWRNYPDVQLVDGGNF